jgi:hypothetical protein
MGREAPVLKAFQAPPLDAHPEYGLDFAHHQFVFGQHEREGFAGIVRSAGATNAV